VSQRATAADERSEVLNCAAIQSGNIKNPSNKKAGLDVSHHALVPREGRGKNFFLDILFQSAA